MREVVIVSACRTPIGKFSGGFKNIDAQKLGSIVIDEASWEMSSARVWVRTRRARR
jgi:acetyl-CoA acetyltransferase